MRLTGTPGEEVSSALLTACLVAGRLQDWPLTLALSTRTIYLWRWYSAPMQSGPCLALCARALAEDRPELAGVLQGASYATFRHSTGNPGNRQPPSSSRTANPNFLLVTLAEAGAIVTARLGEARALDLRRENAAMNMAEAVSYTLANADPSLLTGPISIR